MTAKKNGPFHKAHFRRGKPCVHPLLIPIKKKSGEPLFFLERILFGPADSGQHVLPNLPGNTHHGYNVRTAADQKPDSQNPNHHRRGRKRIEQQQHAKANG